MPVFAMAAFIEGFITRYNAMPIGLSIGMLLASLFFVVYYFVVYPIQLQRAQKTKA